MALAVLSGCADRPAVRVELDAFSGRPNPQWELSPAEASELAARIESLPKVEANVKMPGLGFRGYLLHIEGETLRVYGGYVISETREGTAMYLDDAGIEGQLAADARQRGYGDILPAKQPPR